MENLALSAERECATETQKPKPAIQFARGLKNLAETVPIKSGTKWPQAKIMKMRQLARRADILPANANAGTR